MLPARNLGRSFFQLLQHPTALPLVDVIQGKAENRLQQGGFIFDNRLLPGRARRIQKSFVREPGLPITAHCGEPVHTAAYRVFYFEQIVCPGDVWVGLAINYCGALIDLFGSRQVGSIQAALDDRQGIRIGELESKNVFKESNRDPKSSTPKNLHVAVVPELEARKVAD